MLSVIIFIRSVARNNDFYYRLKEFEANGNIIYSKVLIAQNVQYQKPGISQCNT